RVVCFRTCFGKCAVAILGLFFSDREGIFELLHFLRIGLVLFSSLGTHVAECLVVTRLRNTRTRENRKKKSAANTLRVENRALTILLRVTFDLLCVDSAH